MQETLSQKQKFEGIFPKERERRKYVLLQAPKIDGEYSSPIVIIDNSSQIGKSRVEKLCNEGYTPAGTIESDLKPSALKEGFNHNRRKQCENLQNLVLKIGELAETWVDC